MFTKKRCCLIVILFLTFSYSSNIDTSLYSSFLDINGDKIVDTLELKKIKEIKYPLPECVLLNLWNKEDKFISDTQIVINLLISTGKGNRHKRYIIYNKFFSLHQFGNRETHLFQC